MCNGICRIDSPGQWASAIDEVGTHGGRYRDGDRQKRHAAMQQKARQCHAAPDIQAHPDRQVPQGAPQGSEQFKRTAPIEPQWYR